MFRYLKRYLKFGLLRFNTSIKVLLGNCKKQRSVKLGFEVHLSEHCNLKCAGCGHFSSIAEEEFAEIDVFENDLSRISILTNGDIKYIALLGGEPLLNKDINKFMEISRRYFKDAYIYIVTNGILLEKMDVAFWETARENNIWIGISPYPIKLDIKLIKRFSKQYSVPCGFYQGYGIIDFGGMEDNSGKKMFRWVFDLQGKQNYKVNFMMCGYANDCITLKSGKLYTCAMFPHIKHFNKQFGKNLEITERDYIDIYKAKNIDEIMEFLATPIPFCRYCNLSKVTYNHEWEVTRRKISEWT
jgi:hypothetical protein